MDDGQEPGAFALARAQHGVIAARQALGGGMTRSAIDARRRNGSWLSLLAGVYLTDAALLHVPWEELPFDTRLSAARLAHGPDSVAVLQTAARLHGIDVTADRPADVHLCLPSGRERHQQPGVVLHTRRLPHGEVTSVPRPGTRRVLVTSPALTLADVARTLPRTEAVAALDSALGARVLDGDALAAVGGLMSGRRGAKEGRRRLGEADGRAQSPLETRIRLIACDAGLPPDALQHAVRDGHGQLLGYADLAWFPASRRALVAEADGRAWHELPHAVLRDRRRANDFSATGEVDMVRFTWEDTLRPAYVVSVLRAHLTPRS